MQSSCRKSSVETCTCDSRTNVRARAADAPDSRTGRWHSHWTAPPAVPPDPRCRRQCGRLRVREEKRQEQVRRRPNLVLMLEPLPLIMETSLAPSPMARVTAFLARLISSTTSAFCRGVTRQQITALQFEAMSRNLQR